MSNPKIIVGVGDLLGCGYYRCAVPYKALSKEGFDVELTNVLNWPSEKLAGIAALVLQRQHSPQVLHITQNVQASGAKVVFELDDYFHDIPKNNPAAAAYPRNGENVKNIERFMELSDMMTVSTPGLRDNYEKFNKNIYICPNQLTGDVLNPGEPNQYLGGEFRLGWAGSSTHHDDFLTIVKPVSELMMEYPEIKFIFIGHDYRKLLHPNLQSRCEHLGHTFPMQNGKSLFYSLDEVNPVVKYYDLLKSANLHAAIAPILQVTFNKSKSAIKLMEYGLAGIPWVATNYGPYALYNQKGREWNHTKQIGLLADRNPEWKRAIKNLILDNNFRINLIKNNWEFLQERHLIEKNINFWIKAFESIGIYPGEKEGTYTENMVKS